MPLDDAEAEQLATDLWPTWCENRDKSLEWQGWALGQQTLPVIPDSATAEYRALQEKSITPWLGLVVGALAQALIVEGYRQAGASDENLLWQVWQANNMDAKQVGVYEAAFTTGISYMAVLPTLPGARTTPDIDGKPVPEWRAYASTAMTAFYESAYDDWPAYALAAEPVIDWKAPYGSSPSKWRLTLFDEDSVYLFTYDNGGRPAIQDVRPHGSKVTPVVSYVNRQTITGRALGEVEPYTAIASRIDQDVFDRLVVQRFASWRTRWATGLITPTSEDEQTQQELALKVSDILVSDSTETRFGSLPETPMDGHLRAAVEDIGMLARATQTPPTLLGAGDIVNVSADALAAIEAAYNRKVAQRKVTFGEAHERCFALTAELIGVETDESAQVRWADLESRSLAQTADAFGKLAQMLQIPVEILWDKLGFLTDQDRSRAQQLRAQNDTMGALLNELANGQQSPPINGTPPQQVPVPNGVNG